jgi:hypothetical protein
VLYHQEYVLRAHVGLSTADLETIEFEAVHRFIEMHNDRDIQHKIDLYGAFGTDLTSTECGTSFYRDWLQRKKEEAAEREPKVKYNPDEIKRVADAFKTAKEHVLNERKKMTEKKCQIVKK